MKIIINPEREQWKHILQRPYNDNKGVLKSVQSILDEVKKNGDDAVWSFTKQFDGVALENFLVSPEEISYVSNQIPLALKNAIQQAAANIETFHRAQLKDEAIIETMPGVKCWKKNVAIDKVGLYIPGGTAPLFSTVLMLGIPAKLAGCKEIILCTPCDENGKVHPAVLYSAQLVGVTKIFKVGGAQAIGAMAYGTQTITAVCKIFGPGNQYVTAAKQLVQMQGIAIDMPAGPSEVCVIADETADPSFVAADLLSQAEHGIDSQVLLVSNKEEVINKIQGEITKQLTGLSRKEIVLKVLSNSKAIVMDHMGAIIEFVNEYAPEHLFVNCKNEYAVAQRITNAGSVFIGEYSPESVGDYASGTNHTLPTNGFAKAYSGISVDSFVKKITYQELSKEGLRGIADTVITMAEAEGLDAHANAVKLRLKNQ